MIFHIINSNELCKTEEEKDYFIFGLLTDSTLICLNECYLFLDKTGRIFNLKYGKEVNLNKLDYEKLITTYKNRLRILKYQFYIDFEGNKVSYNVKFNYHKNIIKKELLKYYNKIEKLGFYFKIENISKESLYNFYNLFNQFSKYKGFSIKDYSFFKDICLKYPDNFYLFNVFSGLNDLVGSTLLFKFNDKIILMYGGYESLYIKKGLKYFINKTIIDYFRDYNNINEIIFGTGKNEYDINDSLLKFKMKFGDVYKLSKIEGLL